jgi:MurNAc alpha-1-phosphate uridylyltransferase
MILAAGKGERMRPLTNTMPKPLLAAAGKPLLQYHIEALAAASIRDLVINTGSHGEQIEARFGTGAGLGVSIRYSHEGAAPLGTGGGVRKALPLLGGAPFILVNGDVWTDFDFSGLPAAPAGLAHLVLVANPAHNPQGDFSLEDGRVRPGGRQRLTYSGIGVYDPAMFADTPSGEFSLVPLLKLAMQSERVRGEYYSGAWLDIGTPERLAQLENMLSSRKYSK